MKSLRSPLILAAVLVAAAAISQQNPAQWDSMTGFKGGTLVRGSDGNFYRALHDNTNHDPTKDNHSYWELYYVRSSVVLPIAASGARFSSIKQAWAFIGSAEIPTTATATLSISTAAAGYFESFTGPFSLNQGSGAQIQIVGDDPSKITLQFPAQKNGLTISNGHNFGGINGVTLDGKSANGGVGVFVSFHSSLAASKLIVKNFGSPIMASENSSIQCENSSVSNFAGTGITAQAHSYVDADSSTIDGSGVGNAAVWAIDCSQIIVTHSNASNTKQYGFVATNNSTMNATFSVAHATYHGFMAEVRSTMAADAGKSSNNYYGFLVIHGGYMTVIGSTSTSDNNPYIPTPGTAGPDTSFIWNG